MRICNHCNRAPRQDDPLEMVRLYGDGPTETYMACRDCAAQLLGRPPAADPRYLPGKAFPLTILTCGICKLALRDDETTQQRIRLADCDLDDKDRAAGITAGLYAACRECVEKYRPVVYARLKWDKERLDGQKLPEYANFVGNWLM